MKMNKIISCIIALTMIISMFSCITVSATSLDGLELTYTFENDTKGTADGTITITGVTSELQSAITNINIYWGKNSAEILDDYYNLKYYTVAGPTTGKSETGKDTKLKYIGETFTCVLSGSLAIPNDATHLIADVVTADATRKLSVEIPGEKRLNLTSGDLKYSMIWGSDIHFRKQSALPTSVTRKAVQGAVAVSDIYGNKFKGMIINGDIADTAKNYEYAMAEQFFEEYNVDFPVYYANGNHDTLTYSNGTSTYQECEKAMAYRFEKLEKDFGLTFEHDDPWSYETTIGGHHYIFFATPYYNRGVQLTDARKAWLEEKISMYEKSGQPTFLFTHMPYAGKLSVDTTGSEPFNIDDILERHPSVTVITSHVHMDLNSDYLTTLIDDPESGNNFIDTASMKDTINPSGSGRTVAEGRVVEVYDDVILIKSRDFSENKWIPRGENILKVASDEEAFEGEFTISSSDEEGVINEGTVLTAKLNGEDVPEGYTVKWYDLSGTELAEGNTYTVVTANKSVKAKIVKTEDNSYANTVARYIVSAQDDEDEDNSTIVAGNTIVKYYGKVVNISGNAGETHAGEKATIVLAPNTSFNDFENTKYIGECTIASDGTYNFKFKADDVSANDVFLVKVGSNTVSANRVVARTTEELVEVTPTMDDENILSLSIKNILADTTKAKLIIATYDINDKLIAATPVDYDMAFNENLDLQTYTGTDAISGTYVRVYLWSNLLDMIPLSNSDRENIPNISDLVE